MDGAAWHIARECSNQESVCDAVAFGTARSETTDGDFDRLQNAFERCGEDLLRFIALRVRGDRHEAEDLLQQTCYEAARKRRMPPGEDAAAAWLFGIAKNVIRRYQRHRRRGSGVPLHPATLGRPQQLDPDALHADDASQRDAASRLLTAIAALSEADQQLLLGSYFEGRSHKDLARAIGVTERTIEGRLYRARAALREALSDKLAEDGP